jgi:hypothetical protein
MSWTTAITEFRTNLSDGATDKLRYRKRVFDQANGVNTRFKTFEFRRITDFTSAVAPLGVYVNGVAATVTTDFPEVGEFVLTSAPANGDTIEASYYIQWFQDSELTVFLNLASQWLGLGSDHLTMVDGLRPAAMQYAMAGAYQKLALRFAEHISEMYRLEDAKDPKLNAVIDGYRKAAEVCRKEADDLKKNFYTRQGQSLQPYFSNISGVVSDPVPKR